jgi:hypothetical protein
MSALPHESGGNIAAHWQEFEASDYGLALRFFPPPITAPADAIMFLSSPDLLRARI